MSRLRIDAVTAPFGCTHSTRLPLLPPPLLLLLPPPLLLLLLLLLAMFQLPSSLSRARILRWIRSNSQQDLPPPAQAPYCRWQAAREADPHCGLGSQLEPPPMMGPFQTPPHLATATSENSPPPRLLHSSDSGRRRRLGCEPRLHAPLGLSM
jgi:hypothetical protein